MNPLDRFKLFLAGKLISGIPDKKAIPSAAQLGWGTEIQASILSGIVTWSGENAQAFVSDGYAGNDIVYSVVNMITDKAKIAPWGAYTIRNKAKYAKYKACVKANSGIITEGVKNVSWRQLDEMKNEALIPYENDEKLNDLLTYPDAAAGTTWSELIEAMVAFRLITGNAYMYGPRIMAGKNDKKPLFLMALPSQWMSIIADLKAIYARPVAYRLYMGAGIGSPIDKDDIIHVAKFNPQWNAAGQQLYGMSPLQAARKKVTRINESLTASVANLQNGGPAGVLYTDDNRFDSDAAVAQATALKNKLIEYSGAKNKNRIATSGYKVGWQPIGLSNVDQEIITGEKHDLRSICNVFNVPSTLLNDPDAKNENNQIAAQKALTVNAAIPELIAIRDAVNFQLERIWGWKGITLDFDLSVYPELQEDKKTQIEYLDIAPVTMQQKIDMLGLEADPALTKEMLQTVYYKGQPLSEPGMNDPLLDPYQQNPPK